MSADQASANLATIAAALEQEYPDANVGRSLAVTPLSRAALASEGSMSATTMSVLLEGRSVGAVRRGFTVGKLLMVGVLVGLGMIIGIGTATAVGALLSGVLFG